MLNVRHGIATPAGLLAKAADEIDTLTRQLAEAQALLKEGLLAARPDDWRKRVADFLSAREKPDHTAALCPTCGKLDNVMCSDAWHPSDKPDMGTIKPKEGTP